MQHTHTQHCYANFPFCAKRSHFERHSRGTMSLIQDEPGQEL